MKCHPRVKPPTASPAPSTSFSSPSIRLVRGTGLNTGLARPIDGRIVGLAETLICPILPFLATGILDVGYEPLTVGEEVAELTADIGTPVGIDSRGVPGLREWRDPWASRKYDIDGDTARRFDDVG